MINKKEYFLQVDEIISTCDIKKEYFIILYDIYEGKNFIGSKDQLVDHIIKSIFTSYYSNEIMINYSFLKSPVGSVLIQVLFNVREHMYTLQEVSEMAGITKQAILKDVNNKKINGKKVGGIWLFTKKNINEYLEKRGDELIKENEIYSYEKGKETLIIPEIDFESKEKKVYPEIKEKIY